MNQKQVRILESNNSMNNRLFDEDQNFFLTIDDTIYRELGSNTLNLGRSRRIEWKDPYGEAIDENIRLEQLTPMQRFMVLFEGYGFLLEDISEPDEYIIEIYELTPIDLALLPRVDAYLSKLGSEVTYPLKTRRFNSKMLEMGYTTLKERKKNG